MYQLVSPLTTVAMIGMVMKMMTGVMLQINGKPGKPQVKDFREWLKYGLTTKVFLGVTDDYAISAIQGLRRRGKMNEARFLEYIKDHPYIKLFTLADALGDEGMLPDEQADFMEEYWARGIVGVKEA